MRCPNYEKTSWDAWDCPGVEYLGEGVTTDILESFNALQREALAEEFLCDPFEDKYFEEINSFIESKWIEWLREAAE